MTSLFCASQLFTFALSTGSRPGEPWPLPWIARTLAQRRDRADGVGEQIALALVARAALTRLRLALGGERSRVGQRLLQCAQVLQAADLGIHSSPRSANEATSV